MASALGVEATPGPLPYHTRCPLCGGCDFTIYQDNTEGGLWHHCRSCQTAGDLIELAARAWRCPVGEAAYRLQSRGQLGPQPPEEQAVRDYEEWYVSKRQQVQRFWEDCRAYFAGHCRELTHLQHFLDAKNSYWKDRGGRYAGGSSREEVFAFIRPRRSDLFLARPQGRFGPVWQEALVIPFSDLPGRISSFLFGVREARDPHDLRYVTARNVLPNNVRQRDDDPGVAVLEGLWQPPEHFGDTAFILLDPIWTVHLQSQRLHRETGERPLPAASVWPGARATNLRTLAPGLQFVFWNHQVTADLFRHAARSDGRVVLTRPDGDTAQEQLYRTSTIEWLALRERLSRPWREALEEHLASLPVADAAAFLTRIGLNDRELTTFVDSCGPTLRPRLTEICKGRETQPHVSIRGHKILETELGWEIIKAKGQSREVISTARFRIDEVIRFARSGKVLYRGVVRYRGTDYPFLEKGERLEADVFHWLRGLLIKEGAGVPAFNFWWKSNLLEFALRFHPPRVVEGIDGYGWDEPNARFVFRDFFISQGGDVGHHDLPGPQGRATPCAGLRPPRPLTSEEVAILAEAPPVCWAIVHSVLFNLLSPTQHRPTHGLGLRGRGAQDGLTVAEALGCGHVQLSHEHRHREERELRTREAEAAHGWPTVVRDFCDGPGWPSWLERGPHNCLVVMDRLETLTASLTDDWWTMEADEPFVVPDPLREALTLVVPSFLHWSASRRLTPTLWSERGPEERLAADMEAWFEEIGGARGAVRSGVALLNTMEPADHFAHWVRMLIIEQSNVRRRYQGQYQWFPPIQKLIGGTWVPKAVLDFYPPGHHRPRPSAETITACLRDRGVLNDECDHDGQPGWLVRDAWWREAWIYEGLRKAH